MSSKLEAGAWLVAAWIGATAGCHRGDDANADGDSGESSAATEESAESVTLADTTDGSGVELVGSVQKGPFVLGSSISVTPVDAAGDPLGEVYPTMTTNDLGEFEVALPTSGPIVIEGTGFYYNEVSGVLSGAPLTLRALYISPGPGPQEAYVNLITHLGHGRTRALLDGGADGASAIAQAEDELRAALGVGLSDFVPDAGGIEMNVLGGDTLANAYLLAVSSVLAQGGVTRAGGLDGPIDASLQELVNEISTALASGGTLPAELRAEIDAADLALDSGAVMTALAARLVETGSTAEVPDIDRVLDQDDDTLVNAMDNCIKLANPDQTDTDTDGLGDVCDNCPDLENVEQVDDDADGIGDACDSMCGDSVAGPGEECDDGVNGDDTDDCTDECTIPVCGDGIEWAGEECDDGNAVDGDGCNAGCVISGQEVWELLIGVPGQSETAEHLVADSTGAAIFLGLEAGVGFMTKVSPAGVEDWSSPGGGWELTIDAEDEIVVSAFDPVAMQRFSPDGDLLDALPIPVGSIYGLDSRYGTALAFGGNQDTTAWYGMMDGVFAATWEEFLPTANFGNYVASASVRPDETAAYALYVGDPVAQSIVVRDGEGALLWEAPILDAMASGLRVASGPAGEVIACSSPWVGGGYDLTVLAFDPDGTPSWTYELAGAQGWSDFCFEVAVDASGRTVVAHGESDGNQGMAHVFKLDTDGTPLWTWDYPQGVDPIHYVRDVAIDPTNDEILVLVDHDGQGTADIWLGRLTQ